MLGCHIADRALGWQVGGEGADFHFRHGGDNVGYKCQVLAFPAHGGLAVMTNGDEGWAVTARVMQAVAREYGWPDYDPGIGPDPFAYPTAALGTTAPAITELIGRYQTTDGLSFEIEADADRLLLVVATQAPIELVPHGRDAFVARVVNLQITFTRDGGRATGCTLRQWGEQADAARE